MSCTFFSINNKFIFSLKIIIEFCTKVSILPESILPVQSILAVKSILQSVMTYLTGGVAVPAIHWNVYRPRAAHDVDKMVRLHGALGRDGRDGGDNLVL